MVELLAVTTMPASELAEEPLLTVSAASEKLARKRLAMLLPLIAEASSWTGGSAAEPVAIGASFWAPTVIVKDWASRSKPLLLLPPESRTVQVRLPVPLALARVLNFRPCSSPRVRLSLTVI